MVTSLFTRLNKLSLNAKKTELIIFRSKRKPIKCDCTSAFCIKCERNEGYLVHPLELCDYCCGTGSIKDGLLVLNVFHGDQLFVEYNKNEIIDKINVFFGYQFIKDIKLLLIKEKIDKINKYNFSKEEKNKFQKKVDKINNENLKKNLTNLLDVFNKKK